MTWHPAADPLPGDKKACDAIETIIVPRARDLGGFEVRRALPSARKQMIGPFIFFDQMGPAEFLTNQGVDVRPHPHIGLSTVTYLFEGEIYHRDSLGSELPIAPGEVNWMTAGKGIVHSERTSDERRKQGQNLFGIQTWVAMPKQFEEIDPGFEHQSAEALPILQDGGASTRIIIGNMYGRKSPVKTYSDMFYATVDMQPGSVIPLDADYEERGIYIVSGEIDIAGDRVRRRAAAGVQARRPDHSACQHGVPADAAGRRADGRTAPYLVEFRFFQQGADRTSQRRLAAGPV